MNARLKNKTHERLMKFKKNNDFKSLDNLINTVLDFYEENAVTTEKVNEMFLEFIEEKFNKVKEEYEIKLERTK